MEEDIFKSLYNEQLNQFYNKFFLKGDLDDIFYYSIRVALNDLLSSQVKFLMIQDCLKIYTENNSLSVSERKQLKEISYGVEVISSRIDEILKFILEGFLS